MVVTDYYGMDLWVCQSMIFSILEWLVMKKSMCEYVRWTGEKMTTLWQFNVSNYYWDQTHSELFECFRGLPGMYDGDGWVLSVDGSMTVLESPPFMIWQHERFVTEEKTDRRNMECQCLSHMCFKSLLLDCNWYYCYETSFWICNGSIMSKWDIVRTYTSLLTFG